MGRRRRRGILERDYRGESFEWSDEDRDPLTTISDPDETAGALVRTSRRESDAGVRERRRLRRQRRKYAQQALMMATNPTISAQHRQNLTSALRRSGSPIPAGASPHMAMSIASTIGPGRLPGNVGLVGSRGSLSGISGLDGASTGYGQIVSVWRGKRGEYDYYRVPTGVTLRWQKPPQGRPAFGEALEALLPVLPRASYRVGRGPLARGRIVVEKKKRLPSIAAMIAVWLERFEDGGVRIEKKEERRAMMRGSGLSGLGATGGVSRGTIILRDRTGGQYVEVELRRYDTRRRRYVSVQSFTMTGGSYKVRVPAGRYRINYKPLKIKGTRVAAGGARVVDLTC